jgi:O-antigen/teichoic acid export membrane protein
VGIIIKESFNQTVLRVIISMVGAFALVFIYPLNRELYGIFGYIINTSALLMALVVLGLGLSSMRFFPYTSATQKERKNFFWFIIRIFCLNSIVFVLGFYFLQDAFIKFSSNPSANYEAFIWHICLGALMFSVIEILVKYLSNYKIVAIPVALQTLYKLSTPVAFALVYFKWINLETGIWIIFGVLLISLIALVWMTSAKLRNDYKSSDNLALSDKELFTKKSFFGYYFWAFASSAGSIIAFRIDGYMVPALTTFELNGDYTMAVFITTVITIPISAVVSIAHPMLSEAWRDNNLASIKNIYLKGSENLVYIGSAMLLAVFLLLDFLPIFFDYLASLEFLDGFKSIDKLSREWNELRYIKLLVLVLGISKLFDMASSVNGVIIQHSKWYRHNTYYILVMVVVNVVLNYALIVSADLSIMGAAIATTISLIIFNVMKTILIYIKTDIQPFTGKMLLFVLSLSVIILSIFCLENWIGDTIAFVANNILVFAFLAIWLWSFHFAEDTKNSLVSIKKKWF